MEKVRRRIKSDEIDKTVNVEKQNRHIRENDGYVEGRSYLLPGVNAQRLVDRHHGTGAPSMTKKNGVWKSNEVIVADRTIGVSIDPATGAETLTNRFTIHYSKTGTHIVPAERV